VENFSIVQRASLLRAVYRQKSGEIPVILLIHSQAPCQHGGAANIADAKAAATPALRQNKNGGNIPPKRKTRPGGQPDGSSHMGAGVDGRSRRIQPRWGGITAPTLIGRGGLAKRSKGRRLFLTS
jgi:hypothetical protein